MKKMKQWTKPLLTTSGLAGALFSFAVCCAASEVGVKDAGLITETTVTITNYNGLLEPASPHFDAKMKTTKPVYK